MGHFSIRLIASHMAENGGTNGAFSPLIFAYKLQQA
jgi:hypothetical protein